MSLYLQKVCLLVRQDLRIVPVRSPALRNQIHPEENAKREGINHLKSCYEAEPHKQPQESPEVCWKTEKNKNTFPNLEGGSMLVSWGS